MLPTTAASTRNESLLRFNRAEPVSQAAPPSNYSCTVDPGRRPVVAVMVCNSRLFPRNVVAAMVAAAPGTFCQVGFAKLS